MDRPVIFWCPLFTVSDELLLLAMITGGGGGQTTQVRVSIVLYTVSQTLLLTGDCQLAETSHQDQDSDGSLCKTSRDLTKHHQKSKGITTVSKYLSSSSYII